MGPRAHFFELVILEFLQQPLLFIRRNHFIGHAKENFVFLLNMFAQQPQILDEESRGRSESRRQSLSDE